MEGGLRNLGACAAIVAATLLLAGCGDDSGEPAEPAYTVDIARAQFPKLQRLAEQSTFEIAVRNAGDEPIPNLAVTVHGFGERDADAPGRTLWVIDAEPRGGVTASTGTWTAGRVEPGATATMRWVVTPIEPGDRTLTYEVAAGLEGDVIAALPSGGPPRGSIPVRVTDKAPKARVDPRTGDVIREKTRSGG